MIKIRTYNESDAKELFEITQDKRMKKYKGCINIECLKDSRQIIRYLNKAYMNNYFPMLAIESNGILVGNISMRIIDNNTLMLGYFIGVKYWGNGFATEAVSEMLKRYRGRYKIIMKVMEGNKASERVLMKNGFVHLSCDIEDGIKVNTFINNNCT